MEQGALARGVEYGRKAVLTPEGSLRQLAGAFSVVVRALHWSIFEFADGAQLLTPSELETAVALAELWLERLEEPSGGGRAPRLPKAVVSQVQTFRSIYYIAIADPDLAERLLQGDATQDPNLSRAFELASDGRTDEAMALLPKTEHPWLPELQRANFLSVSRNDGGALALLRNLATEYPERGPIELILAECQSRLGRTEQAAETAWDAFQRGDTRLTVRDLSRCAEMQLVHDTRGLRTIERVRRLARLLHERFAGAPEAESYKLELRLRLGDDPELPQTDFGVLEEHGLVRKFHIDELLAQVEEWKGQGTPWYPEHSQRYRASDDRRRAPRHRQARAGTALGRCAAAVQSHAAPSRRLLQATADREKRGSPLRIDRRCR